MIARIEPPGLPGSSVLPSGRERLAVPQKPAPDTEAAGSKQQPAPLQLDQMVEQVNETARLVGRSLLFEIDKDRILIRVVDTGTGEVIRQIPPESFRDSFRRMVNAVGLILDGRA